jgi:hypothetical protein
MKKQVLFIVLPIVSLVAACHIPDLGSIDLSGCMETCNAEAKVDCKNLGDSNSCFDTIDACFHSASDCSDACVTCETDGTCTSKDDCNQNCVHLANSCTDLIHPCIDQTQQNLENGLTDKCVGPLLDCIDACIADTEDKLKGKK